MKHEWKKAEKNLYMPRRKPEEVIVPKFKYFIIEGRQPGEVADLKEQAEVLSRVSKTIRDMPKRGFYPGGFYEYTPYPLELLYTPEGKAYKLMIRQPEFVTGSVARMAVTAVVSRNPHPLIGEVSFISTEDGHCVQIMCTGAAEEDLGEKLLSDYIKEQNLKQKGTERKKIFLNDPVKTAAEKQKYVLREFVESVSGQKD